MFRKHPRFVVVFAALLFGLTTLAFPRLTNDIAIYTYIGETILAGGAPYIDAWDIKPPGVYLIYALQIFLGGESHTALRVFDLVWHTFTALLLAQIGTRVFRSSASGLIAGIVYLVLYYSRFIPDLANADGLLTLPLALAVIFSLRGLDHDRLSDWVLAAFFVGITVLIKLPMGLFGIVILAIAVAGEQAMAVVLKRACALALGVTIPLGICAVYLYLHHALGTFIYSQFVLGPEYVSKAQASIGLSCLEDRFLRPSFLSMYASTLLAAIWIVSSLRGRKHTRSTILIAGWLGLVFIIYFWQGKYYTTHSLPLLAPLALVSAQVMYASYGSGSTRIIFRFVVLCTIVLSLLIVVERNRRNVEFARTLSTVSEVSLGQYIRQRTTPDDKIAVWGSSGVTLYAAAGRRSASRFISSNFLEMFGTDFEYREIYMAELAANKPSYIILIKQSWDDPCIEFTPDAVKTFREFDALQEFIGREYEIEEDSEDYTLYTQKTNDFITTAVR